MAQSLHSSSPSSPPWEVLLLVAERLDAKTLAAASCVCKSWSISMASDHLWEPIFAANFPSLSNLAVFSAATSPPVSFRRLFSLGHTAAASRRPTPSKPTLSLSDLVFIITVSSSQKDSFSVGGGAKKEERVIMSCVKHGGELAANQNPNGLFKFDINVSDGAGQRVVIGGGDEVEVAWNVVLGGWRGVFTMIECGGKLGLAPRADGWFSEELPAAGCCPNAVSGGVVADLKLGLCRNNSSNNGDGMNKVRIESVSVGMLSVVSWKYVCVEDGLMYLQHFLYHTNL